MADGCRSTKTQPLCREGPFLLQSLSLESGCRWGFTCDHTRAWLPLPFPASQPFQASSGSLSLINHFHRNVWLRICFWENLISEALGRLLPLQLCTSLMAILRLKLALYRKKNLLCPTTACSPQMPSSCCPPTPRPRSNPTQAVLPEGNARCSGKSAPKPQPAHILAVGSHQSLFTGAIFSLKESCCALGCSVLSLCRVPLICMTRSSSWGSDPEGSWEASN